MKLKKIKHVSHHQNRQITREITCILGMPFYKSSGTNSSLPGTWFPFLGITEEGNGLNPVGSFIKPFSRLNDRELNILIRKHFPRAYGVGPDIEGRFSTVVNMLISSKIGGGIWEKESGQEIRTFLEAKYPDFYKTISDISFEEVKPEAQPHTDQEINQWLCKMARVKMVVGLKMKFPRTVDDLLGLVKPKKVPLTFNYQSSKDGLGSKIDAIGKRRSCRINHQQVKKRNLPL